MNNNCIHGTELNTNVQKQLLHLRIVYWPIARSIVSDSVQRAVKFCRINVDHLFCEL